MSEESDPLGTRRSSAQQSQNHSKVRRRNRIITSCLECRRRKLKCDRLHPCNHCAKASRDCVFLSPALDSASKGKLNQFKESIDHLEKGLERHADGSLLEWTISSQNHASSAGRRGSQPPFDYLQHSEAIPEDEQNLEPSPLTVADVTYDDEGDDLMDDLGIKMGKMRITERIGGFVRPRFADEIADTLRDTNEPGEAGNGMQIHLEAFNSPPHSSEGTYSYLEPGPEYISPDESLLFSNSMSEDLSLITFLPSRDFADKLITQYWAAVHLVARVVHRSTFEQQYNQFWQDVAQGFEPSTQLQALVFAAMFSAAVSLPAEITEAEYGCSRDDMIRTFRAGCEHALSRSKLLRATKFPTIQAFVMYLIPICRADVTRAHASLVSMITRLAECAGLHRDGTTFGLSPVEVHVRRLVWYQLCFLDIRTVEAVGPRPGIRKDDFDTKFPLHVDDKELEYMVPPKQDAARFTDMTAARIRFESYEILRAIWIERPLIDKGQSSLTALLRKVEDYRKYALHKYMPLIDKSIPFQLYASKLLQMLLYKMHLNILHRYAVSVSQAMPERLFQLLWSSSTGFLETSIEMDTMSALRSWAWYLGAYTQHHVALLLLFLVHENPDCPEGDRIWAALDYIFEFPDSLSRPSKVKLAMSVASHRLDEYQKQRKRRVPTSVDQSLGGLQRSASPPNRKESSGSSFQPLQTISTPSTIDSSYGMNSVSDRSSSDTWLHPPSSRGSSMGYTSPRGTNVQAQPINSLQQIPTSNTVQYSAIPNLPQNTNPQSISGLTGRDETIQPFADLDWDELNRLFPIDAPMLSFDTPLPQPKAAEEQGLSAMTYFPSPWPLRSEANDGHNFGNLQG